MAVHSGSRFPPPRIVPRPPFREVQRFGGFATALRMASASESSVDAGAVDAGTVAARGLPAGANGVAAREGRVDELNGIFRGVRMFTGLSAAPDAVDVVADALSVGASWRMSRSDDPWADSTFAGSNGRRGGLG